MPENHPDFFEGLDLPDVFRPTERPDEPITAGSGDPETFAEFSRIVGPLIVEQEAD